jgi:hypothetical protein
MSSGPILIGLNWRQLLPAKTLNCSKHSDQNFT